METFLVPNRHALVATEDEKYPVVLGIADGMVPKTTSLNGFGEELLRRHSREN